MDHNKASQQELAISFINETSRHIFITGKAGTGKTTLLRELKAQCRKRMIIAAPTGVAAINAGGVTLHSLFKLPPELILPGPGTSAMHKTIFTVLDGYTLSNEKEKLLRELEVLVIDEVSMMRVDVLDAIDHILRHVRGNPDPFGGIQVVYFGDLYQLPPVASPVEEAELLRYYRSVFFFDALVMITSEPIYIELTKVFRQKDPVFLKLLNNIRNNEPDAADFDVLTGKYLPDFQPPDSEHYIRLTSHRKIAHDINIGELARLSGEAVIYQASSSGIVDLKSLPVEEELHLKTGAQVMFVRNDLRGEHRYFNGKIGIVTELRPNHIRVTFPDGQSLDVEQELWRFIQYQQNENDQLSETSTGEFKQYPLRLAWAITIHKSQGLTFDQAIIDAGSAFAAGQVYVALSRVRTLEGVVLLTPIRPDNLVSRNEVVSFAKRIALADEPASILEREKRNDVYLYIRNAFRLFYLLQYLQRWPAPVENFRFSPKSHYLEQALNLLPEILKISDIAEKFLRQLDQYWNADPEGQAKGADRLTEASAYFSGELNTKVLKPLKSELTQMLIKRAPKELIQFYSKLERLCTDRLKVMNESPVLWTQLLEGVSIEDLKARITKKAILATPEAGGIIRPTSQFTATQKASLKLFNEGRSITEIAEHRKLGLQIIESHILLFVESGHVGIDELVLPERIAGIRSLLSEGKAGIHEVKSALGNDVNYFEVRSVIAHLKFLSSAAQKGINQTLF